VILAAESSCTSVELAVLIAVPNDKEEEVVAEVELRMGCGLKRGGKFRDVLCDSSSGCCGHGCGGRPVEW
jgi:hypothetical protein